MKKLSIPLWCYIIMLIVSAVFIAIPFFISVSDKVENVLIGIGCSLFATFATSILIDRINTKKQTQKDKDMYIRATVMVMGGIIFFVCDLPNYIRQKEGFDEFKKQNFDAWTEELLSIPFNELERSEALVDIIESLKYECKSLIGKDIFLMDNAYFSDESTISLRGLINSLDNFLYAYRNNKNKFAYKILTENFKNNAIKALPVVEQCFEMNYNLSINTDDLIDKLSNEYKK